jgi:CBS domain containing-hemolysin-like protein
MVVNVSFFAISTVLLIRLGDRAGAAVTALASVLPPVMLILFGEVTPKLIATRLTTRFTRVTALPMLAVHRTIQPLRLVLQSLVVTPLARLVAPEKAPSPLTAEELEALLRMSTQRGVIDRGEQQLLEQVLSLGQVRVKDVMTPRVDVVAFDLALPPARLIRLFRETRRSRIPVYRDDLDHVAGVVLAREVLRLEPRRHAELMRLVRPARFVPELMRADQLLSSFRDSATTFAMAVDEYGGTAGLVTLEDVVEHMVGSIAGPLEADEVDPVLPLGPGRWRVSADLSVRTWANALGLPRRGHEVSTLGGLVMARLGRVARVGDRVGIGNVALTVEEIAGHRPRWLTVQLTEAQTAGDRRGGAAS